MSHAAPGLTPEEWDALAGLVARLWGGNCRIAAAHAERRSDYYAVLILTLAHGPGGDGPRAVVVKLAGPAALLACPFDRTAALLRRVLRETDLPVPAPLAHDTTYRDLPWRYLVTVVLPGQPWHQARRAWTTADLGDAQASLGRTVAALHTLHFPAHGEIAADGTIIDALPYPDALAARARRRIADPAHAARFVALLDTHRASLGDPIPATLAHEDLNPTNLLVAPDPTTGRWALTGLLDFDSAWAGGPESDLARLALWDGMAGPPFWDAHGVARPLTPAETARRLLLQLLWCLEYAQPTSRHHADTARLCAALGIAPFTFA